MAFAGLACAAMLAAPNDAQAQRKKKKKAQVQALTQGGPTLKFEQFRRRVEVKVAAAREQEIRGLKRLLELGAGKKDEPDIKFRLAELYFEKSQLFFFRSQEVDDAMNRATDRGKKAELKSQKRKHVKESQVWSKRAVELYREIREYYPKYARMPEVLFALGQNYWTAGRQEDAIDVYRELIKHFRDSPLVADAWVAFGEYYFASGALHRALKSYEHAASDKRSRVYGFAVYKQAWCYYNLSDWKKALEKFRATVFYSQMADELSGENKISLAREAQKDFVKTYAHIGDSRKARFELADITNSEECKDESCQKLMEVLAGNWAENGRFEDGASLYKQLIKLNPGTTRNPYFQGKIVDLVSRSGDKKRVIAECRRLVDAYNRVEDIVSKLSGGSAEAQRKRSDLNDAKVLAESTIRRLAQLWNREAKKTRQPKTYDFAQTLYADYLQLFPKSKYAYEMTFQYADLLYKLESFDKAAMSYRRVVEWDTKGKYVVDAANDNVLAVEEHLKDLRLKRPKAGTHQVDIHEQRKRLIAACDMYAKFVPADKAKKLVAIKFKAAKIYYDHNHFTDALKRFDEIVAQHPDSKQAEVAANLVIDVHNLNEDWNAVYAASVRYRANKPLLAAHEQLRSDLNKFGQYAKFKLIAMQQDQLKKDGRSLAPIADEYEKFQKEFPGSENADKALFNASVIRDTLGDRPRADGLRRKLLTKYKDSPLRAEVAHYVAKSFADKAQYKKAADLFAGFAKKHAEDGRARDALYNAAVFYAGVGAVRSATRLRELYLKRYGKTKGGEKEAASIYYSIAADLERAGKLRQAAQRYKEFSKKFGGDDRAFEALWREASIYRSLGRRSKAEKVEGTLFATYRKRKRRGVKMPKTAADYASRIAFSKLESAMKKYKKVRVHRITRLTPRSTKKFQKSLVDKAKARVQVIKAYTKIVTDYQQAHSTISSLYMIAVAWDDFAGVLVRVPCPRGLNEEQCGYFKEGIEKKIGPAREGAYQAYLNCIGKSQQLNIFTPYSTRCVKALEKLAPEKFPPMDERQVESPKGRRAIDIAGNDLILDSGASLGADARAEAKR